MNVALAICFSFLAICEQPRPECTCAAARGTNGWCDACRVGYVAGLKIPSLLMYDALDAHGHDIDPAKLTCASCRQAVKSDGFCDACRMGFTRNLAYLSRLTYYAAKGRVVEAPGLKCLKCRAHLGAIGWCDACNVGIVGNVAHADRASFDALAAEYRRLAAAVERIKECETCAVASMTDGRCLTCKKAFENGEAKPLPRP